LKYLAVYTRLQIAQPMAETFAEVLKSVREATGLSLSAIAARTHFGKSTLGHIENGIRQPSAEIAAACDKALGTSPLLARLFDLDGKGDTVQRRTLMRGIAAGLGGGGIGMDFFAAQVQAGLLEAIGEPHDWDSIVDTYRRRLVQEPSAEYGESLLTEVTLAHYLVVDAGGDDKTMLRAAAELSHLYGLWLGNQSRIVAAHGWYKTSIMLADRSTDLELTTYMIGRTASREVYEGATLSETIAAAEKTLALSRTATRGVLEANSALAHAWALTGDLAKGRTAIIGMENVAGELADADAIAGPVQRTWSVRTFFECRTAPIDDAYEVFNQAERMLRSAPVWLVEARMYWARAQVAAGDVTGGIRYALEAIRTSGQDARIIGVAVRDILFVVPAGYRSEELDELRLYAAKGAMPWEMLV